MVELGVLSIPRTLKRPKLGMSVSHETGAADTKPTEASSVSKIPADVVSWSGQSPVV